MGARFLLCNYFFEGLRHSARVNIFTLNKIVSRLRRELSRTDGFPSFPFPPG